MIKILMALAMGAALVTGANAADLGGKKVSMQDPVPVSEPEYNWTRIWGFLGAGYGMTNISVEDSEHWMVGPVEHSAGAKLNGLGGEGAFGEAQIGLDYELGKSRVVFGVYGGGSLSNSKSELKGTGESGSDGDAKLEQGLSYFGGGRVGFAFSPTSMAYVGGGYRWTEAELNVKGEGKVWSDTISGPFAETGLEGRLTSTIGWKVFGRYTLYDDQNFSNRDGVGDPCWNELEFKPGELQFGAGLTASFGAPLPKLY